MNNYDYDAKTGTINLKLSIYDLVHDVFTKENRDELIESLSCHEEIIDNVMDIVLTGLTENGFSGCISSNLDSAMQRARNRIAKESDYSVRYTIEGLERKIKNLEESVEYWRDMYERRR